MYDLEKRVIALEAILRQLVRVGTVSSVDDASGTARVYLPDSDNIESYPLRVLVPKTQDDKVYSMPDKGEQVLCIFLPYGLEQGFILGSFYSKVDTTKVADRNITRVDFSNGSFVEHNRKTGLFTVSIEGNMDLRATGIITINGQEIYLN